MSHSDSHYDAHWDTCVGAILGVTRFVQQVNVIEGIHKILIMVGMGARGNGKCLAAKGKREATHHSRLMSLTLHSDRGETTSQLVCLSDPFWLSQSQTGNLGCLSPNLQFLRCHCKTNVPETKHHPTHPSRQAGASNGPAGGCSQFL